MNGNYNFDKVIDRRGTDATKFEELKEKFGRDDLLPLWIADMDFPTPAPVRAALHKCIDNPVLGYTTAPAKLMECIAAWLEKRHGWSVSPGAIGFIPGVKKGIGLCVNYFTGRGDKILIQPPVYHSFRSVVEGNGRIAVSAPLHLSGAGYTIDTDALEKIVAKEKPRMMIICNPQNPIGIQWSENTLRHVASICHHENVILLSDEIYGDLVLPGQKHIPTASVSREAAEITVTLGAPSKSFNMPGIASAWTAVPGERLREGFFAWLKASEFDTPPISAIYSTIAAYTECQGWLDSMLGYIAANSSFAMDYIRHNIPGADAIEPRAGFGLWIDFRNTGLTHEEIMDRITGRARLAVSDGASFGAEGRGFVRLNFGVSRNVLKTALERIKDAFSDVR